MLKINDVATGQQYQARTIGSFVMYHFGVSALALPARHRTAVVGTAMDVFRPTAAGDMRLVAQLDVSERS